MIKLKNILASNMRRFGTKNLSEEFSDTDQNNDGYPDATAAGANGITYKVYKDPNHRNFLYIDFMYNPGLGTNLAGLSGQVRAQGAKAAMDAGNRVSDMISKTYNIEDIEVVDQENGKVQLFAVSDDFVSIDPKNVSFFHTNIKALLNILKK